MSGGDRPRSPSIAPVTSPLRLSTQRQPAHVDSDVQNAEQSQKLWKMIQWSWVPDYPCVFSRSGVTLARLIVWDS